MHSITHASLIIACCFSTKWHQLPVLKESNSQNQNEILALCYGIFLPLRLSFVGPFLGQFCWARSCWIGLFGKRAMEAPKLMQTHTWVLLFSRSQFSSLSCMQLLASSSFACNVAFEHFNCDSGCVSSFESTWVMWIGLYLSYSCFLFNSFSRCTLEQTARLYRTHSGLFSQVLEPF